MTEIWPIVDVFYPSERDIPSWSDRWERGEIPSRWPYGLNSLEAHQLELNLGSLPAPGRIPRAISRIVPAKIRAPRAGGRRRIALVWDENAAGRLVALAPHREMYSGLIWMTDKLATAGDDYRKRMLALLGQLDGVFVISRAQVEPLTAFLGGTGPRVDFVRFGIDHEFWSLQPYPETPLVFSVGGDRDRDTRTLFESLDLVASTRPDVEIVVQTSSSLAAPSSVTKLDHLTHGELRAMYARASVVSIATHYNLHASGMTVSLEAMATGRPVVMSDAPGIDDYVRDGDTGILTPIGDAPAMAKAIVGLLDDPAGAAAMGLRGRRAVETHHTTDQMASQISRFILNLPAE
jgi:glycosyltransferase involved in cell wall biosynthesis